MNYNNWIADNNLQRLNILRARDEKRFFLMRIVVELESLQKKFERENRSPGFIALAEFVSDRVNNLAKHGCLSKSEIKDYCLTNKIRLNYDE